MNNQGRWRLHLLQDREKKFFARGINHPTKGVVFNYFDWYTTNIKPLDPSLRNLGHLDIVATDTKFLRDSHQGDCADRISYDILLYRRRHKNYAYNSYIYIRNNNDPNYTYQLLHEGYRPEGKNPHLDSYYLNLSNITNPKMVTKTSYPKIEELTEDYLTQDRYCDGYITHKGVEDQKKLQKNIKGRNIKGITKKK